VRAAVEIARSVPRELTAEHDGAWAAWIRTTFGAAAHRVGWKPKPNEDPDTVRLRDDLLPFVADIGRDRDLARDAVALARRTLRDPAALTRDARQTLFTAAARVAGDDAQRLYAQYVETARRTGDDELRRMLIAALGGFRVSTLQAKAYALLLSDVFVPRETFSILRTALMDAPTRPAAIAWLERNADAALVRAPAESARGVIYWADGACRDRDRDAIERLFASRAASIEGGAQALAETLEQIDVCLAYRRMQKGPLDALLRGGATRTAKLDERN
jgi:alanyl aminopeptidase